MSIPAGYGASWVDAGKTADSPLPAVSLVGGSWRAWHPHTALRPVCRMAGASVDGRMGTAVAAEDDTDPGSHSMGNTGVAWASRVPELRWSDGTTMLAISAPRVNRGIFVSVDDATGICTINHQITGFSMGSERDFGLSMASASGLTYFGAPTAQTSHVRQNGKPGRLYVIAYCHPNFNIRWPPAVSHVRQCDPCASGRRTGGGIPTGAASCA